ncbi:hypothetical protein AB0J20_16385 [Micromonospora costi]|uniref:hypothetical protein n=1 Tax=Micromonospora costi TaxID=1530042 RepID=UPI0033C0BFAF
MSGKPYTDTDVQMVALALADACPTPEQCADTHDECVRRNGIHWLSVGPGGLGNQHITAVEGDPRAIARVVLDALAAAGRLLPAEVERIYTAARAQAFRDAAEMVEAIKPESSTGVSQRALEAYGLSIVTALRITAKLVAAPTPEATRD